MGLKDWLRGQLGAEGEVPAPPPLPKPPGDAEIRASLERVHRMLDEGHASPLIRSRAARIDRLITAILPRLPMLGLGSIDAYAVVATATDYLPEAVGGYLRLPREWADSRPIDGGRTALMVLIDQLELLGATMDKMLDAANRADAQALIAHGRFLDSKFGGPTRMEGTPQPPPPSSSDGPRNTLDLGS